MLPLEKGIPLASWPNTVISLSEEIVLTQEKKLDSNCGHCKQLDDLTRKSEALI